MTLLNIPSHLLRDSSRSDAGLHLYYNKYQACLKALSVSESMDAAGAWEIKKPSDTETVELFIGKTMWHDHLKKQFSRVPKYPEMLQWLNDEEDVLPDIELWGEEKTSYNFKDLKNWLDDKDKRGKVKGKGKAKEDENDKKKKKVEEEEEEEEEDLSSKKYLTRSKGKKL